MGWRSAECGNCKCKTFHLEENNYMCINVHICHRDTCMPTLTSNPHPEGILETFCLVDVFCGWLVEKIQVENLFCVLLHKKIVGS